MIFLLHSGSWSKLKFVLLRSRVRGHAELTLALLEHIGKMSEVY